VGVRGTNRIRLRGSHLTLLQADDEAGVSDAGHQPVHDAARIRAGERDLLASDADEKRHADEGDRGSHDEREGEALLEDEVADDRCCEYLRVGEDRGQARSGVHDRAMPREEVDAEGHAGDGGIEKCAARQTPAPPACGGHAEEDEPTAKVAPKADRRRADALEDAQLHEDRREADQPGAKKKDEYRVPVLCSRWHLLFWVHSSPIAVATAHRTTPGCGGRRCQGGSRGTGECKPAGRGKDQPAGACDASC
jgi:hypothetical protein